MYGDLISVVMIARALEFNATIIVSTSQSNEVLAGFALNRSKDISVKKFYGEGRIRLDFSSGIGRDRGIFGNILKFYKTKLRPKSKFDDICEKLLCLVDEIKKAKNNVNRNR